MMPTEQVERSEAVVSDLKGRVRGPLLLPGSPGFDEARSVWNAMIDRRPALILRCLGVTDVIAGVNAARERGLSLSIKGGGHNIAGLAVCEGGLMLDMSLMRGVWVDPAERVAHAQAGCLLGDIDAETQVHGLAAVLGFVSATGCAGLTLGGGFGYLTRRFGWTSDNLASIDLVTADGKVLRASEREHSDLFWGLRGGGGNFGVATSFEYKLHAVGPTILGGAIAWRGEDAAAVLEMYRSLVANAPPELTCVAGLRIAPPAPWIAKEVHGKPIVALFVCHSGAPAEAEAVIASIKSFGTPVGDVLQQRSYVSQQMLLDATQPKGRRYYWKSEYLRSIGPDLFARAIAHATRLVSPHSAILIFPIDGALNRVPERPLGGWQPRRVGRPQHRERLGARQGRRGEHRVGAEHVGRPAPVLHRRHLHQFPDRGGRDRTHAGGVSLELRAAGPGQGRVGSGEPVPHEQEHRSGGGTKVMAASGSDARSHADLIELLDRFADAWNRHDLDALMSMMTDDCVFEASAGPQVDGQRSEGKEAVRAAYAAVFEAFPDAHWANPRHFIAGNRGVSEWTFTGTQKDGKRVEVTGCDLFTFRDGKIAVKNSYRKNRPAI